jgi:plasmid replication initiation protein
MDIKYEEVREDSIQKSIRQRVQHKKGLNKWNNSNMLKENDKKEDSVEMSRKELEEETFIQIFRTTIDGKSAIVEKSSHITFTNNEKNMGF